MAAQIPQNPDQNPLQKERTKITVDSVPNDDLVYSLEVKLIQSEKDSFLNEGSIKAETSCNDRYPQFDSETIFEALKKRTPNMNAEDLKKLRAGLISGTFSRLAEINEKKQFQLYDMAKNSSLLPENEGNANKNKLKTMEKTAKNLQNWKKKIDELVETIQSEQSGRARAQNIRDITGKKIYNIPHIRPAND